MAVFNVVRQELTDNKLLSGPDWTLLCPSLDLLPSETKEREREREKEKNASIEENRPTRDMKREAGRWHGIRKGIESLYQSKLDSLIDDRILD